MLARHLVDEGNALGFGGDQDIVLGGNLEQVARAGNGQLNVAEDDESADVQIVVDAAEGQIAL